MDTQTLNISGMTCQHCVTRVRDLLAQVAGVMHVDVELMPPRAHVTGDDIDIAALNAALAGTSFAIKTARLPPK